jgi:outer membrane lipoprotein carrier protein
MARRSVATAATAPVMLLALAALLATETAARSRAADQTAVELALALQARYDTVKDFSAEFVQTYRGGVLNRQITEKGQVLIKKPGRMRWEYTAPEKKLFVSDGTRLYQYIPDDKQVVVTLVPPENQASTPALFLAGKGHITRDFTPSFVEPPAGVPPGSRGLKLTPTTAQPDYEWLVLAVDPATLALRGLVTLDRQGGTSTFSFANLKENLGLADKLFDFKAPRGVDVLTDSR